MTPPAPTPSNEWAHLALVCRRAAADLEQARRRLVPGALEVPERIADAADVAVRAATALAAAAGSLAVLAERRERHEEDAA